MEELDSVILITEIPEYGLKAGDIGTVVLVHGDCAGYEVEFTRLSGETLAVVSLSPSDVRSIGDKEIAHARVLECVTR